MNFEIYMKDLENRFPDYTFRETRIDSMTKFEAIDRGDVIASSTNLTLSDAVFIVRTNLVGGLEVTPMLTTSQIDNLKNVKIGTSIFDLTSKSIKICTNSISNTWE
jgi:hypothetical protein